MTTMVLVERSEVMARGIASLLTKAECKLVGFGSGEDELLLILESVQPDLVLFGRGLPSSSGVLSRVFEAAPKARGVAIRERIEAAEVLALAAHGIIGILHEHAGLAKYRACIGSVVENCQWIDPEFLPALLRPGEKKVSDLTCREVEVIDMVQRGWRNKQIARGLGITEGTVKMHLHHIFTKMRLATRTELALAAAQVSLTTSRQPPDRELPTPEETISPLNNVRTMRQEEASSSLQAPRPNAVDTAGSNMQDFEVS
jgi:two-component system nitrate/nitrite response regulator NarL